MGGLAFLAFLPSANSRNEHARCASKLKSVMSPPSPVCPPYTLVSARLVLNGGKPRLDHAGLVGSVEKLSHRGILKLTKEKIYLICAGESNTSGGPQVWAQINVKSVFSEFRIESNVDDQIFLEFVPTVLSKALKSTVGATEVIVRLAKRASTNTPVLAFLIKSASRVGHSMSITQEVAVKVLKLSEVELMAKEPMCPEPDVHVMLPQPSETMRGVVEKMKNIDNIITISSNLQGVFRLRAKSDLAGAETEWRGLSHPEMGRHHGESDLRISLTLS